MTIPQAENESEDQTCDDQTKKIEQEIVDLRLLTIVSERRTVPAIMQLRRYWRNRKTTEKKEFENAVQAFWWTMVALIFPGGGSGGVLTLIIAAATIYLGIRSNQIATQSNALADRQIAVEDAARRAAEHAEVTAILDQINSYQINEPNSPTLPSTIVARIQAVTHAMRPYMQPSDSLQKFPLFYSPERSQLLSVLTNLGLTDYGPIIEHADFSYSYVYRLGLLHITAIPGARFGHCKFEEVNFAHDTLVRSDFSSTEIKRSSFYQSNFAGSNFTSATWENVLISTTQFSYCDFGGATLRNVFVDDFNAFQGANFQGATVDSDFFRSVIMELEIPHEKIFVVKDGISPLKVEKEYP